MLGYSYCERTLLGLTTLANCPVFDLQTCEDIVLSLGLLSLSVYLFEDRMPWITLCEYPRFY